MTVVPVADQEILQGVAATLEWVNVDGDGTPTAAGGAVTVTVTKADGTAVATAQATTTDSNNVGRYTYALTAAQTATLDQLTAVWTDAGDSSTHTTIVDIVGGYLFSITEARGWHGSLSDITADEFVDLRREVTDEVEWICDVSFRPRFRRLTLDGSDDVGLVVPDNRIRTVTAVTVDGTAYTAGELAALHLGDRVIDQHEDIWPAGQGNVVVAYTYGESAPERPLRRAALDRLRTLKNKSKSGIPERALRMNLEQMGSVELDRASRYKTGYPDIDAVYGRYSLRGDEDGSAPAQGFVDFNPQYGSLFHGGRR